MDWSFENNCFELISFFNQSSNVKIEIHARLRFWEGLVKIFSCFKKYLLKCWTLFELLKLKLNSHRSSIKLYDKDLLLSYFQNKNYSCYISLLKIYVIQYDQILDAYDCLVRQVKYLFSCSMATVVMA